ncbi:MAG: hypothetical protein SGARI_002214 [Bacillariaceae sp.]
MAPKDDYLGDVSRKDDNDDDDDAKESSSHSQYKDSEAYLDDLKGTAKDLTTASGGTRSSNEYLSDSSNKEPENYLGDMAKRDGSSKDDNDDDISESPSYEYLRGASSERLNGANGILEEIEAEEEAEKPVSNPMFKETVLPAADTSPEQALESLLTIAARTGRGERATADEKLQAESFIKVLEANNPTPEPTKSPMINGRWELLYSSTQLFRSSPFFMAGRAVCTTEDQAQQYDWFCDMHRGALAISNIGAVRQIVSPTLLVSEFEVKVGAIPFFNFTPLTPFPYSGGLPFTIDGAIVSSADISPTNSGDAWELYMDTVQIRGSNVPGLRRVLDEGLQLSSRDLASFLEENVDGYTTPRPIFDTTYLSETLRISREQDGKVFVYQKISDDTSSTDYTKVEADLGLLKFLEGLNDNVIKYYE